MPDHRPIVAFVHSPLALISVGITKADTLLTRPHDTMTIPDGAACYFCLGEEGDEEGMPTYHA